MISPRPWILFLALLAALPAAAIAATHDMYICVSQSKPFIIGTKVQQLSGLFRVSEARAAAVHVGFNHPRQDSVAVDPRDPGRIYTVGLNGVLRSTDGGLNWRIVTGWEMTEPKDIAIDPANPDTVYVGLPDGIGVSRDAGDTWKRSNAGITRAYTQSIVVDRSRPRRLLAGTELGIYLSEDGAVSWRRVFETRRTVNDVRQSPHDPKVFLAVTQSDGAVRSTDGGLTWQILPGIGREATLHNGDFDPHDPRRLVVCGWGIGVQVSDDNGATWNARGTGLPAPEVWRVAFDPDVPGRLYASPHQNPIYSSDDLGRTWKARWFSAATVWDFVFVPRF